MTRRPNSWSHRSPGGIFLVLVHRVMISVWRLAGTWAVACHTGRHWFGLISSNSLSDVGTHEENNFLMAEYALTCVMRTGMNLLILIVNSDCRERLLEKQVHRLYLSLCLGEGCLSGLSPATTFDKDRGFAWAAADDSPRSRTYSMFLHL